MAIVTLDVTGQILHPDLTPASGTVTFQIPHDLNDVVDNVTYAPGTFTATLDVAGNFTITDLIATDSPDITETWMYRVHVLTDAYAESFSTTLPAAFAPVADFTDLIPAQVEPCTDDGSPCATLAQIAALQAEIAAIGPGAVSSVNGEVGVVVLDAADVGADPAGSAAAALVAANTYTDTEIAAIGGVGANGEVLTLVAGVPSWEPAAAGGITSVNGDVGPIVVLTAAEVGADPAGSAAAAQAAAIAASLQKAANLGDLANAATARTNLGLGNVDNTSDLNKPISTATQTALNLKVDKTITVTGSGGLQGGGDLSANRVLSPVYGTTAGTVAEGNDARFPASAALLAANNLSDLINAATARTNLGLGNVDNTSDLNKPVSTAMQAALDLKLNTPNVAVEQVTTWTAADEWVRVNTPYSAGDTNPDLLRFFNGPAGISPTVRLNGNAELRTAPSNDARNGSRHFEFLDGSNGTFWSVSTNPTDPLMRVDRLHVNGTLEVVRPGWTVASEGVEAPEFLQAGLSLLPSAWTVPSFTASWGSSATVSDGAVTGATDAIGTQFIPAHKRVWLRGTILNSTGVSQPAQTVFMTIAAAHRPATWKQFPGRTSTNLAVRITVKNTGAVVVDQAIANAATLSFDGINWDMP